jgi:phosphatidylserine/phosphatidylglycerophosphate/cardiolipin synthase-like enzyme
MNSKNGLKIAEYVSLGMSFIGLTIAGITQQFMFALAPLSLNLSLGTIRRQRLERSSNKQIQELVSLKTKIPGTESLTYGDLDRVAQSLQLLASNIGTRIDEIDRSIISSEGIEKLIQNRLDRSVGSMEDRLRQGQLEEIKKILPRKYNYTLVSGRSQSREVFLDALQSARSRIILVCPWLTEYGINEEAKKLIVAALERGVSIDIGWGHFKDVDNKPSGLSREELLKSDKDDWKYNAIPWLDKLQAKYSSHLTLKVLGTHEKFLVCDRQFAMLGSHNYLTSGDSSNERELGLKTDSPEIINELIELFEIESPHLIDRISSLNIRNKPLLAQKKRSIV